MNKSKLAIGLMTAMLSAGALAGCDNVVKYSDDGAIITYNKKDEDPYTLTADKLLEEYYKDSSKYQSIFDTIYSIVVRNYFNKNEKVKVIKTSSENGKREKVEINVGLEQMPQIKIDAQKKVDSDKKTAELNAANNGTSYSDEFNSILSSKGAENEDELKEKYIEELKKETFDSNFYKYHIEQIKNGDPNVKYPVEGIEKPEDYPQIWNGYFKDMVPYHVSHILVKVEDGSGTNYANGTISEANAKKLYNVVDALIQGKDSFGTIAHRFSEDTGSAASYGDLGIMDYSTGYVNEFKLGIYAYENFMGNKVDKVVDSNIKIPGNAADPAERKGIAKDYQDIISESFDEAAIPTISYKVFEDLNEAAETDKDINNKSVLDDSANFYPRNIIYNKYLNRHSAALITIENDDEKYENAADDANTGFRKITVAGQETRVLSVRTKSGEWTPILCARAGSDYQGIHFIIVNRSPFVDADPKGVSLDEYYTTYYPEQEDYPAYESLNAETGKYSYTPKETYVNFSSSVTADTKAKADSLVSTLKSYDSERLNKYIFKKFFDDQGIKISDAGLETLLNKWISRGFEKKAEEKADAWEKTWNDYLDTLRQQLSERTKLVSQACRIAYLNGNDRKDTKEALTTTEIEEVISKMADELTNAREEIIDVTDTDQPKFVPAKDGSDKAKVIAYIKSIRVGDKMIGEQISKISDLFKKEGALCNDGKEHL